MTKIFFKNSLIYTIGNVLVRGISIFLIPIYTRYLSPSEYGIIDLFVIFGSLVSLSVALEISQAIARYYQDAKTQEEKTSYTSTAFLFTIFMYGLYIFVSFIFSEYITVLILDDIKYHDIFLLATVSIATSGIFYFTQNQLKWQIQPKDSVIVSVINIVIIALVAIYLLTIEHLKLESIFIAQIFGNIIAAIVSIYFAKESYRIVFVYARLKEMLNYSYPLVFSSISVFIALYIDRIMIKEFLDLNELGIYGIAYRFASVVGILMIGFQQSLTPLIFKHYKEKQTPMQLSNIFNIFIVLALSIYLGSILFSSEIIVIFTTEEYYSASAIVPFLVLILLLNNMYIFFPGLSIEKKTKTLALLSFLGAIINTILNYVFVQKSGLTGVAFATLLSSFIIFFIRVPLSNKYYFIPYDWIKITFSFLIIVILGYAVNNFFSDISLLNIVIKFFFLISVFATLLIYFFKNKIIRKVKNVWY